MYQPNAYQQQQGYDPNSYTPSPQNQKGQGSTFANSRSPPPLQHPVPQHPILNFRADAASPSPQMAHQQPQGNMNYYPQQQAGNAYPQQNANIYSQFGFNDPAAQMGMQFAGNAMAQGTAYVEQNLNRWVNIPAVKHYFNVNNLYVINKMRILLFPWRHSPWTRMARRSDTGQMEGYAAPREDINSPDLYIPVMAFVTYVLLCGLAAGRKGSFHPEVLGFTASASLAIVFTEVLLIRLGIYLLSIPSDTSVLDLVAYSGYKFVGVIVTTAMKQLGFGGWAVYGVFLYTALSCGFFLLRSMRYLALPDAGNASTMNPQRKRRMWFLLMIAASQLLFMFCFFFLFHSMNPEIFKTTTPTVSVPNRPHIHDGVLGALHALSGLSLHTNKPTEQDGLSFKTSYETVSGHNGLILTLSVKSEKGVDLCGPLEMKFDMNLKDMKMHANGFQSWSQAKEMGCDDRIQKIRSTVAWYTQFHLQGDYDYFEHTGEKGQIHSSSYTHFRDIKNNLTFLGSLAEESGYTYFKCDFAANTFTIHKDAAGKTLNPNQEIDLIKVLILHGNDQESQIWDTYASYFKDERFISGDENPERHVNGWTSWYYYYGDVSEEIVLKNLNAIIEKKYPINIFQIDDGFQTAIGDWLSINNKFPNGMKNLVSKISKHGIKAGLWLAPYAVGFNSRIVKEHPDWILKEENDSRKMLVAGPNWGGFYALDMYNEGAREYLRDVFDTVLNKWGFDMVKLDFLFAAAMIPRLGKTRGEIMWDAVNFIREIIGPNKIILGCGVPLAPSWRKVDYCRIGSDVAPWWEDSKLKMLHVRERVSTANSLVSTLNRWAMSDRMFGNDPDVMILRSKGNKLKSDEKYTLCTVNNILGALVFISDDVSEYTEAEHMLYSATFPKVQAKVKSVIEFREELYCIHFHVHHANDTVYQYTTYVNLSGDKQNVYLPAADKDTQLYFATDNDMHTDDPDTKEYLFYQPSTVAHLKQHETKTFMHIPPPDSVQLMGTTGHIVPGTEIENITKDGDSVTVNFMPTRIRTSKVLLGVGNYREQNNAGLTINGKPAVYEAFAISGQDGGKIYAAVIQQ